MYHWACVFFVLAVAHQIGPKHDTAAIVEGYVVHSTTGEPVSKAHVSLELSACRGALAKIERFDSSFADFGKAPLRIRQALAGRVGSVTSLLN